jgi:hypothetical protein
MYLRKFTLNAWINVSKRQCRDQRMSGAIHPLPNTPSLGRIQLKAQGNFTLPLTFTTFEVLRTSNLMTFVRKH